MEQEANTYHKLMFPGKRIDAVLSYRGIRPNTELINIPVENLFRPGEVIVLNAEMPKDFPQGAMKHLFVPGDHCSKNEKGDIISDIYGLAQLEGDLVNVYNPVVTNEDTTKGWMLVDEKFKDFQSLYYFVDLYNKNNGIKYSLPPIAISEDFVRLRDQSQFWILFAESPKPIEGWTPESELLIKHEESEDDNTQRVDYREKSKFLIVKTKQPIIKIFPGKEPIDGSSIYGEKRKANLIEKFCYKIGENLSQSPQHPGVYMSSIDGHVAITEDTIHIKPVLLIEGDVNLDTGNIHYHGTVEITGNITDGMTIQAGGDIIVAGFSEPANIECKGSLQITGGIIGRSDMHIKTGKNIIANFVQNANVKAGGDILIAQSIVNSSLFAKDSIIVSGPPGHVVSGNLTAGNKIEIVKAGSPMESSVVLNVGFSHEIEEKIKEKKLGLYRMMEERTNTMNEIIKNAGIIKLSDLSEKFKTMPNLQKKKVAALVKILQDIQKLLDIEDKELEKLKRILLLQKKPVITVKDTIHEGAKIIIDGKGMKLNEDFVNRIFTRDDII